EKEKVNLKTIESLKSKGFESSENVSSESKFKVKMIVLLLKKSVKKGESKDLDIFGGVRIPKKSDVIWKKKGLSNTSNVGLSAVRETRSVSVCDDAMNVSCNSRMNDLLDDNNFFIFDDVNVRISPVRKMLFRKKPRDSMQVHSKSNMIKSLPRTVHKWFPKLQPLAEPVAKWFPRIVQICLWIIDSGCSKHMTGNRALLTNFVEKFLGTVRFGNNDFAVIAGYGDGNPQMDLGDQGVIDSGCSRHMTWNMSYLTDYEEIDGGYVSFGGNPKGGKITVLAYCYGQNHQWGSMDTCQGRWQEGNHL
nr:retrovirus-related Pol polyprotein from transposon TNT 1-94 [Tanacetum cinerariifolium]